MVRAVNDMRIIFFYAFWKNPERVYKLLAYAQLCREGVRKLVKKFNKKHPRTLDNERPLHFINSVLCNACQIL